MENNRVLKLNRLAKATPELESLHQTAYEKISRMVMNSADVDYVQPLLDDLRALRERRDAMTSQANQSPEDIESLREEYSRVAKRVDSFEAMFLKFNVPRLCDSQSLEAYTEAVAAFMKVWRDEAKNNREVKEEKSLMEWIRQLDEKRNDTFNQMRLVLVDLGIHVSTHLIRYFMFLSVTAEKIGFKTKVRRIRAAIECLNVEEDLIIIDTFAKVLTCVETVLDATDPFYPCDDGYVPWFEPNESDWIRRIMKEVLRLEVAFSCPDLPMMLIDEVLVGMASHLREVVEKKLGKLESEMKSLAEGVENSIRTVQVLEVVKEAIASGMVAIWKELDLNFVPKRL